MVLTCNFYNISEISKIMCKNKTIGFYVTNDIYWSIFTVNKKEKFTWIANKGVYNTFKKLFVLISGLLS